MIVIGALLSAEGPAKESYLDTIASAVIAAALYWLAHGYATVLGHRLKGQERLTVRSLARALAFDWPLIRGASVPLLTLVVSALAGASRGSAVSVAVWSSIACLAGFEVVAAVRSQAKGQELVVEVLVGLTMGVAILTLKIVLH